MDKSDKKDIITLIARNLAGLANSTETVRLKEWVASSPENKQYFEQIRNIWEASDKKINPDEIDINEAWKKVLGRIPVKSPERNFWYYWQKIAAILIVPLALGTIVWIYLYSEKKITNEEIVYNEIFTPFGTRTSLKLADSTLVWLNSGSSLRYPDKFIKNERKVFLNGEAYFEVDCDIKRPFIVETSTLQIKATGTKFDVLEYDSNPVTEVSLISGKVFINEFDNEKNIRLISELDTDQHFTLNRQSKENSVIEDDTYKYIAWKDGKLIFRNEPLSTVLNKLSMLFNVDIELRGKELHDYRYHATFQEESLEEILKLLKLSSPIDFTEVKRKPLPDGSFPKKKVIIFPVN